MSSKQQTRGLGPPTDRLALYLSVPCPMWYRAPRQTYDRHCALPTLRSFVDITSYTNTSSWVMASCSVPPALSMPPLRRTCGGVSPVGTSPPRHHSLLNMTARYGFFSARGWGLTPGGAGAGGVAGS